MPLGWMPEYEKALAEGRAADALVDGTLVDAPPPINRTPRRLVKLMIRLLPVWPSIAGCWTSSLSMILSAVTEDFAYEDAVDGRFTKAEFAVYLEELFATETTPEGFETIVDVVRDERDGEETTRGWWRTLATPAEGAGLVKAP